MRNHESFLCIGLSREPSSTYDLWTNNQVLFLAKRREVNQKKKKKSHFATEDTCIYDLKAGTLKIMQEKKCIKLRNLFVKQNF